MPKKATQKKSKKTTSSPKEEKASMPSKSEESTIESLPEPSTVQTSPTSTQPQHATEPIVINPPVTEPQIIPSVTLPTSTATTIASSTDAPSITFQETTPAINPEMSSTPNTTIATSPEMTATDDFEPEHKGNGMKILLIFITALIVGGGAVAGFLYFSQLGPKQEIPIETVTPTKEPMVSPTEPVASDSAETLDVSSYSVQILNGSGIAGQASRAKDALSEAGFSKFSVGNADSYDFTDTEVQIKKGLPENLFDTIKTALKDYSVVKKEVLETTSTNDVVIIVGKQK